MGIEFIATMKNIEVKPTVLYLDDDASNLDSFTANFRKQFTILTADSPIEAYNMLADGGIDIVVVDQNMPSMSGLEFLETVATDFPEVQRILITAYAELISVVEAVNKGRIYRVITKPFNTEEIRTLLVDAYEQIKSKFEKDHLIDALKKQNQQFEFLLRQRLLS